MLRTLITLPPSARKGSIIEIRALIQHPMETGYRPGSDGRVIARDLIRSFRCEFEPAGGTKSPVFTAELHAAIAANPYLNFFFRADATGTFHFAWVGDNGVMQAETRALAVT